MPINTTNSCDGEVVRVPPICVSIIVTQGGTHVVNDIVYYVTLDQAIEALRLAADRLERT